MFGNFLTACTIAKPIRWVNEILPPRVRLRWLLMTIRLSIISLAGMARTLVAVGTSSDADMFLTTVAVAPRSTCTSSPSAGGGPAGRAGATGAAVAPLLTAAVFAGGADGSAAAAGCASGRVAVMEVAGSPSVVVWLSTIVSQPAAAGATWTEQFGDGTSAVVADRHGQYQASTRKRPRTAMLWC